MSQGRIRNCIIVTAAALAIAAIVTAQKSSGTWRRAASLPKTDNSDNILVRTEKSDTKNISFRYKIPELSVKELTGDTSITHTSRLQLGNAPIRGNEGEPVLPVIPVKFVIPYGSEVAAIKVSYKKKSTQLLPTPLEFGKAAIPFIKQAGAKKAVPNVKIYNSNEGFPEKNYTFLGVQIKRGVAIGIINLHPVTYFPYEQTVEYYSEVVVEIQFKRQDTLKVPLLRQRATQQELKSLGVENPEGLRTYQKTDNILGVRSLLRQQGMELDKKESFQYVVITSGAIRDAKTDVTINDLIKFRRSNGVTATLVTVESIFRDSTGVDNAEKVRNFIKYAYTNWNTEYVVLGGDTNIVPVRYLYVSDKGGTLLPSDLYYQCLDGTYNEDKDEYWGEPTDGEGGGDIDLYAEVYVGRISAETPEEMSNAVYKIMAYERDDAEKEYLRYSCMIGEELGQEFGSGEFGFAYPYLLDIKNGSSASGYITKGFSENPAYTVDSLYDWHSIWPVDSIKSYINSNKYSIINHYGHAKTYSIMKMTRNDADSLKNNTFIFLYTQGCHAGNFTADCIAEHLTTSTRHGLFAGVFNSSQGYSFYNDSRDILDGPSQRLNRQFWDAYFNEHKFNLGAILADSHEDNVWDINGSKIRYCIYENNLFGDPYTMIRSDVDGPDLIKKEVRIYDSKGGNGDNIITPGETVELSLVLQNTGNRKASDVTAVISISDKYISVSSSKLSFGTIKCCGDTDTSSNSAIFTVSEDCPTRYTFPVTIDVSDNTGHSWVMNAIHTVNRIHTIQGKVSTLTGNRPIAGADVYYYGLTKGGVKTNSDGEYTIKGIEGSYELVATADGYISSDTITIELPPSISDINFVLGRPIMSVDPLEVKTTLKVNDSTTIPLHIANSGDLNLLVTPSLKRRMLNQVLYLTTILKDSKSNDIFVDGMRDLNNVALVDVLNAGQSTPILSYLKKYDIVVVASTSSWANPELLGNTLADYVDAGGKLCMLVGSFSEFGGYALKGRIVSKDYLPLKRGRIGKASKNPAFIKHEITDGLTSLSGKLLIHTSELLANGKSLGTYETGYIVGAYHKFKPIVVINVLPWDKKWEGDLIPMMKNAFNWYANRSWFSIDPSWFSIDPYNEQLRIDAGGNTTIELKMNSLDKIGGLYRGEVHLAHNDPLKKPVFIVPVELTIDGFKSLSVSPDTVDFGQLWLGLRDTIKLTLSNNGTEKCIINSITSDNPIYMLSMDASFPLSVHAGEHVEISLVYFPDELGNSSASVTILSDAEDNGSLVIPVTGECTPGPEASLKPTFMNFSFESNFSPVAQTAILENTGIEGAVLKYKPRISTITTPSWLTLSPTGPGAIEQNMNQQFTVTSNPKGLGVGEWVADVVFKTNDPITPVHSIRVATTIAPCRSLQAAVESIDFGTVWVTRDSTIDIILINDCSMPVTVKSLTFKGNSFESIIGLPFTVQPFYSKELPVIFTPESFGSTDGTVIISSDAEDNPFIEVSLHGKAVSPPEVSVTPRKCETTMAPGKKVLKKVTITNSGGADFHFKINRVAQAGAEGNGITDSPADAVGPFIEWLSSDIKNGVVPAGEMLTFTVSMNSKKKNPGAYNSVLKIQHVFPYSPGPFDISCSMTVLKERQCISSHKNIIYNDTWLGRTDTSILYLKNAGNAETTVEVLHFSNEVFSALVSVPLTVPPYDSVEVPVCFTPEKDGKVKGGLTIKSDADINPVVNISFTGTSVKPPVISYSPYFFQRIMLPGKTQQGIINLQNTGGADYSFKVSIDPDTGRTIRWFRFEPDTATIVSKGSYNLALVFNSSKMVPGTYKTTVELTHKKGWKPDPLLIPCELTVLPVSHLSVTPKRVDFGDVELGMTSSIDLKVVNTGNIASTIHTILNPNKAFTSDPVPVVVPPFSSTVLKAVFTPRSVRRVRNYAIIISDAVDRPLQIVKMTGKGVKPSSKEEKNIISGIE